MRINLNKMASEIVKREGGRLNLSIAQVKEVQRHTLDILAEAKIGDVMMLLAKRKDARLDAAGG